MAVSASTWDRHHAVTIPHCNAGCGVVMKQSAVATCASKPSIGQAFNNAFSGVTSTVIRWGLAVSAFGSVMVSTPKL